jgi:hypothetical protein
MTIQDENTKAPEPTLEELLQQKSSKTPLSFGEKLVGITFNPSNDGDVALIKTKMAEIANLIHDRKRSQESSELSNLIYNSAITSILEAQMMAVKYVTLKY